MSPIFPIAFASEEARLLTAVGLGFLFGFALERAGFGNARKLAAQFYMRDMTVFKVMFTAIIVAMVGLYTINAFGLVDLSRMYVNPTFVWAQLVGGFLLGVGFIMSGLCPGTSVVSAASGRWDGLVTLGGIFVGTVAFNIAIDAVPALERLYGGGSLGESLLPDLLNVPAPVFAAFVVLVALAGFVGAEKVERLVGSPHQTGRLEPRITKRAPQMKFAVAGVLAMVAVVGAWARPRGPAAPLATMTPIAPLQLAERIIERDPTVLVLDVRGDGGVVDVRIPGALAVGAGDAALPFLEAAGAWTTVVVVDDMGSVNVVPAGWPTEPRYRVLRGGLLAWEMEVLTPAVPDPHDAVSIALAARQAQISAFFTGAAVQSSAVAAPPPAMPAGGAKKKKKPTGC